MTDVVSGQGSRALSPPDLEAIAAEAAAKGAAIVRARTGQLGSVGTKSSPTDPVTALDLAVEQVIREHLARRTPGASFLGEEEGARVGDSSLGWILDPIDGTVNLTYDVPLIAVSLAATVDGEVVAGSVVDVWRDEVFSAAAGAGARLDGSHDRALDRGGAGPRPGGHGLRLLGRGARRRGREPSGACCPRPATSAASGPRRCTSAGWPAAASMPTTSAT